MFSLLCATRRWVPLGGVVMAAALSAACSPTFNWREVPVDAQAQALMPCNPDRAERDLPVAPEGVHATIAMAGCSVGKATFAVAAWPGLQAEEAKERLELWQSATRAQWQQAIVEATPARMPSMSQVPAPTHWRLLPAGENVVPLAQVRWFAHADAQGRTTIYQATVLGQPSEPEALKTFFDGLQPR